MVGTTRAPTGGAAGLVGDILGNEPAIEANSKGTAWEHVGALKQVFWTRLDSFPAPAVVSPDLRPRHSRGRGMGIAGH